MPNGSVPKAPRGLGAAGRALWKGLHAALPRDAEFDEREVAILEAACRQADDVAALEAALGEHGVVALGSKGQPRLSALVTEARQGRLAVARLLGELDLSDEDAEPRTARSRRAQHAARARWDRREVVEMRRRHGGSSSA